MDVAYKHKSYAEIALICLGIAFLTILTTYPLFLHMGNSIYGFPGDSFGTIWDFWRHHQAFLADNFPSYHCGLIAAPFGRTYLQTMLDPLFYEGLVLTILTNEVVAYNLMVMLGIWASGFVAYLLGRALWRNQWAAILSGVIFGFCPALAMTAGGHMGFTHLQWMPLYLLSLFSFKQKRNWPSAILCGIALSIVVVTNYYLGYIMIVATAVFIVCWASNSIRRKSPRLSWKPVGLFLTAVLIGTILSFPWTGPILRTMLFENVSESPIANAAQRPYHSLFSNSARPWDYLLPPIDHPVLGTYSQAIYDSIKGWKLGASYRPGLTDNWFSRYGNWWGQAYLGWTPLALAGFGLTAAIRRRKRILDARDRFALIFFVTLFGVTVWFAMPPEFPVGELVRKLWPSFPNLRLPTPSYFLYNLLPMFRRYAVFGIGTILSVAILAGFGIRELLLRLRNRWKKAGAITLIFGLVFFEYLHGPRHTRFPSIPQEYEWLATQPEDIIIAEYPFIQYRYGLFFQRYHGKRMLNAWGQVPVVDKVIAPNVEDLSKPSAVERLGTLGVRYVFVHTFDYFGPNPWDSLQHISLSKPLHQTIKGLRLIKETPTAQIFEITDSSALVMVYPDPNEKANEPWLSNKAWKWQSGTQRLYIVNASDKPVEMTLSAKSPQAEGRFRVFSEEDSDEGFKPLRWNNGHILISDVECAAEAEAIVEVSFPKEIDGEATVWSDINVDVVPRSNLVTNGSFSFGYNWEKQSGWTIANDHAIATNVSGSASLIHKSLVTKPGRFYKVSYTVSNHRGGEVAAYFGGIFGTRHAGNGTFTDVFKAYAASSNVWIAGWENLNCNIDNVSCFEVSGASEARDFEIVK